MVSTQTCMEHGLSLSNDVMVFVTGMIIWAISSAWIAMLWHGKMFWSDLVGLCKKVSVLLVNINSVKCCFLWRNSPLISSPFIITGIG